MIVAVLAKSAKTLAFVLSTAVAVGAALATAGGPLPPGLAISVQVERAGGDLAAYIRALSAPEAHQRALAACRISEMRGTDVSSARDPLLALLADGEPVESRLCRDHGNWGGRGERESSPGREAAIALKRVGEGALRPLLEALDGGPVTARENAALALGLIEDSRALDALAEAMRGDAADAVRARAAWALGMIESAAAVEPLERALDDGAARVREQAAWALGMIESSAAVEALSRALRDGNAEVREQAAWALGMIESSAGVAPLVGALADEEPEVREQAAWALGMIESPSAVPGLLVALRDDSADVREQAAWALGMIEDGAAVEGLMDALEDEDVGVRKQALWALVRCVDGNDADLDYAVLAQKLRRALIGGAGRPTARPAAATRRGSGAPAGRARRSP